ncbi:Pollen Ole e 1 allergen and extensin family protein [Rhynchospora pubera]|uniref:Pollen Ole e 1 allergen and extensin family protein n=1 Tax=Rhynchospora pubera TaxID=906938 RepID=A0AAV8ETH7_9POAL|nr:Pollen Ole e 1 allergen and extensin family protein [Rhynchospora pubera]
MLLGGLVEVRGYTHTIIDNLSSSKISISTSQLSLCFATPSHERGGGSRTAQGRDPASWSGSIRRLIQGAEVAVLCITKSGEVINYQAFTNSKGIYSVAETMPESDRWESCLARPISSFSEHCSIRGEKHSGVKFSYKLPSGQTHKVRPFLYKPTSAPVYCSPAAEF